MEMIANIKGVSPTFAERFVSVLMGVFTFEVIIFLVVALIYWGDIPETVAMVASTVAFIIGVITGWRMDSSSDCIVAVNQSDVSVSTKWRATKIPIVDIISVELDRSLTLLGFMSHIDLHIVSKGRVSPLTIKHWQSDTDIFEFAEFIAKLSTVEVKKKHLLKNDPGCSFKTIDMERVTLPAESHREPITFSEEVGREGMIAAVVCAAIVAVSAFFAGSLPLFIAALFVFIIMLVVVFEKKKQMQDIVIEKGVLTITIHKGGVEIQKLVFEDLQKIRVESHSSRFGAVYILSILASNKWRRIKSYIEAKEALAGASSMAQLTGLTAKVDARVVHDAF